MSTLAIGLLYGGATLAAMFTHSISCET